MKVQEITSVFRDKKVFLTGHTGFKGSWLLAWLSSLGAVIRGYSLAPEESQNHYEYLQGDSLCTSIIADIRDKDRLKAEITAFQPDFIFHLAAQPLVRYSYQRPVDTFEINVIGTANLLEALRELKKPCVTVVITTDKVYENKEWTFPYRENDRLGGYDPYSASKACAELTVSSFTNSFYHPDQYELHKQSICTARAGNVIGGGDWAIDRIIPDTVKALIQGKEIIIRNPRSIRPWQHVLEPLYGYLVLAASLYKNPNCYASSYNFGPLSTDTLCVEDLVKYAIKIWGAGTYITQKNQNDVHEAGLLRLEILQAITDLNWIPRLNSEQAIDWTISWYKKSAKDRDFTYKQIQQYESLL